eukprot:7383405-Prymnesium_polylepis.1
MGSASIDGRYSGVWRARTTQSQRRRSQSSLTGPTARASNRATVGATAGGRSTFSTTTTPSYSTRRRSSDLTSSCRRTMGRSRRRALLSS